MCSYSEFKKLLSQLASSSSPVGRASALAECHEALDVWHDKALDALVSRADLLREVCSLREQLHDARAEYLALWDIGLAADPGPDSWDDIPDVVVEPTFSTAFAAELVSRMDRIMSTQEATVAALARLGSVIDDEAGW